MKWKSKDILCRFPIVFVTLSVLFLLFIPLGFFINKSKAGNEHLYGRGDPIEVFIKILVPEKEGNFRETKLESDIVEPLDRNNVVVRIYDSWQKEPGEFRKCFLTAKDNKVSFDYSGIKKDDVVIITAEDQTEKVVAEALGNCVYSNRCSGGEIFTFPRVDSTSRQLRKYKVTDAIGEPVQNANVVIRLWRYMSAEVILGETNTDESGFVYLPHVVGNIDRFRFLISHPDYGMTFMERWWPNLGDIVLPFVKKETAAYASAIWGYVLDVKGQTISGAKLECEYVSLLGGNYVPSLHGFTYNVITDEDGYFTFYLPNEKQRDTRGFLIPLGSKYKVRITTPIEFGYCPEAVLISSGRETEVVVGENQHPRVFSFRDGNGLIVDEKKLSQIQVAVSGDNINRIVLKYKDIQGRKTFPLGFYKAELYDESGIDKIEFEEIEITEDSSEEIVFQLKEEATAFGNVIHGITGEPVGGAFVVSSKSDYRNSCSFSADDWSVLNEVSGEISADANVLTVVRGAYVFDDIVITDEQGQYRVRYKPGHVYNIEAFSEGYMDGRSNYLGYLGQPRDNTLEIPDIKIFPAARCTVKIEADIEYLSIMPRYIIDEGYYPGVKFPKSYGHWIKPNRQEVFYIPAGVPLCIKFDCPYDKMWNPLILPEAFQAEQGETIELGNYKLNKGVLILVKAVDSKGDYLEGIPIRRNNEIAHNTDEQGYARFFVPPHTKGIFRVSSRLDSEMVLREEILYSVNGREDENKEFKFVISDEMIGALFGN